jgi:hypothetical protein
MEGARYVYIVHTYICVPQRRTEVKADNCTNNVRANRVTIVMHNNWKCHFLKPFSLMKQWKCIVVVEEEPSTFPQITIQDVLAATFVFNLFGNLHEMK